MITAEGCNARRKRLWDALEAAGQKPDVLVIADPQHLTYFAGYHQSPFVFRSNDAAAILLLYRDGPAVIVADNLVGVFAEKAHADERHAPVWYRSVESAPHREAFLVSNTLDRLGKSPVGSVGVELAQVPAGVLEGLRAKNPGLKVTDLDPLIRPLKRRKDPDELTLLRASMRAGEAGQAAAMKGLRPGMTELQAYLLVQEAALRAAGEQAIVYGDFVSGPRTEGGGGPPSDRVIAEGDLFISDFSVVLAHYRCDFANTFVVAGGKPTAKQREMFEACTAAMAAAEAKLRAGVPAREVDAACRNVFAARHLDKTFPHHTGHGIGLGHPEPPYIVPESSDTLVAGDVVTIEPGNYIKGVGGMRFERNYLVTQTGFELLSKHAISIEA
jgi:Xaa-Pro aminopeptidase